MIIDFHTHTFPDKIAKAAINKLQSASHTKPFTDGTVKNLKESMKSACIDYSVVLPVATNPGQVVHINDASLIMNNNASDTGIISFGCMHPDFDDYDKELERIARSDIKGIKLHPVYQGVNFDDIRYLRILDKAGSLGLTVIIHAGFDVGFPGVVHSSPKMILNALKSVGQINLVLAHMGGWRCWEEAESLLFDTGVYIDTSFALGDMTSNGDGYYKTEDELELLDKEQFLRLIRTFGVEHTLFGTDCPWGEQETEVNKIKLLPLRSEEKNAILGDNASTLLNL